MSQQSLHPQVADQLAQQLIARIRLTRSRQADSPATHRTAALVVEMTQAQHELTMLIGAIAGAERERELRQLFWPNMPGHDAFTGGTDLLDNALAAAGSAR